MTGADEKEDPAPKDRIEDEVPDVEHGDGGQEGDKGGTDEATNEEEGGGGGQTCEVDRIVEVKWKDEDTDEEIYEVDCIVGVKWARHKHGVKEGKKTEHLFRTRWKGCDESEDTWEPLTNLNGDEISENLLSFLISPDDAQAHALQIIFR